MKRFLILAALLLAGCQPQPQPQATADLYILSNDGFHCDTQENVVEQMYLFMDGNKTGYIRPGCEFAGRNIVVKLLARTVTEMAAKVEMDGREVWVMDQSLRVRADRARLSAPRYKPIPQPTITERRPGKQYL